MSIVNFVIIINNFPCYPARILASSFRALVVHFLLALRDYLEPEFNENRSGIIHDSAVARQVRGRTNKRQHYHQTHHTSFDELFFGPPHIRAESSKWWLAGARQSSDARSLEFIK